MSQDIDRFIEEYWQRDDQKAPGRGAREPERNYEPDGPLVIRPLAAGRPGGRLPRRTLISLAALLFAALPLLYLSAVVFDGQNYLAFSLLMVIFSMVPFFAAFEGRKPQTRELVLIAVLSALGAAGRAALFMFPSVKPVAALVIIAGVSLGPESGFLVGCMTMLVSDMLMGQGPWTPWQMFSFGLIGFLAGVLSRKGILRAGRGSLCLYGALSVVFIYGGIMNPASVLMSYGRLTPASVLAFYISGLPVDLVHAGSTVLFLWLFSRPLLEKLERIKRKYGLLEND